MSGHFLSEDSFFYRWDYVTVPDKAAALLTAAYHKKVKLSENKKRTAAEATVPINFQMISDQPSTLTVQPNLSSVLPHWIPVRVS